MISTKPNKENFAKWSAKIYDELIDAGIDMDDDRIYLLIRTSIAAFLKDNAKPMTERLSRDVKKEKDRMDKIVDVMKRCALTSDDS